MKTGIILKCIVALLLGILLSNILKDVCGFKVVEGQRIGRSTTPLQPILYYSIGNDGDGIDPWLRLQL